MLDGTSWIQLGAKRHPDNSQGEPPHTGRKVQTKEPDPVSRYLAARVQPLASFYRMRSDPGEAAAIRTQGAPKRAPTRHNSSNLHFLSSGYNYKVRNNYVRFTDGSAHAAKLGRTAWPTAQTQAGTHLLHTQPARTLSLPSATCQSLASGSAHTGPLPFHEFAHPRTVAQYAWPMPHISLSASMRADCMRHAAAAPSTGPSQPSPPLVTTRRHTAQ